VVFGNILGIADADIVQLLIISTITLLILGFKWKDLLLFTFDPNQAKSIGLNTTLLHFLLLALLSATAVSALQTVGACLVVAMLVTPGATAYLLTDRFRTMMLISGAIGISTAILGAYASYFLNGSTGGSIVVLQVFLFLLALFFAPKHGMAASRLRTHSLLEEMKP